ncbi:DUF2853 family protein [Flavobacteriaceae bacterium]|jgi:hypothetical protein|nr:DUF2853 family protein [Flavobacteriaceae bacterium]
MNKRDELMVDYVNDLRNKCSVDPDLKLLKRVAVGCGPAIYTKNSSMITGVRASELNTIRNRFLIKKLGLSKNDKLDEGIDTVMKQYGESNRYKFRVVVYYLLTKHFKKELVYG